MPLIWLLLAQISSIFICEIRGWSRCFDGAQTNKCILKDLDLSFKRFVLIFELLFANTWTDNNFILTSVDTGSS